MTRDLVVIPTTGQVYDEAREILPDVRSMGPAELAYTHGALTDLMQDLGRARNAVELALAERVDQANIAGEIDGHTLHADGFTISVANETQFDDKALRDDLLEHADDLDLGLIRLADLFSVTYSLRKRDAGALAQSQLANGRPEFGEYLDRHRKPPKRKVKITRPLRTPLPQPAPPAPLPPGSTPVPPAWTSRPNAEDEW